jgi:hypothetical protein
VFSRTTLTSVPASVALPATAAWACASCAFVGNCQLTMNPRAAAKNNIRVITIPSCTQKPRTGPDWLMGVEFTRS